MASHSSVLAWRIPWIEEPGRLYSPWGRRESDVTELTLERCCAGLSLVLASSG